MNDEIVTPHLSCHSTLEIVIQRLTRDPLLVFFIAIACFLFSCKEKTVDYGLDTYYVEIVTAQGGNRFLADNGKALVVTENQKTFSSGDRVLLNYTLLSSTASGGDWNVRINGSAKIPLGKLVLTNDSTVKASPRDPVRLESVWLGSNYLNMQLYINYLSATHKVGLIADSTLLQSDTLRLYFSHDTNNDPLGYPAHTYLSFDLKDVLGSPLKTRPILVQINTSNYGNTTYEFEY